MPAAKCFYCDKVIMAGREHKKRDYLHTRDHIYPSSMKFTPELKARIGEAISNGLNTVPCCAACNSYKGRLEPLDWLVIMPDNGRAAALAQRLVKMGEDMEAVFSAMRRRKR